MSVVQQKSTSAAAAARRAEADPQKKRLICIVIFGAIVLAIAGAFVFWMTRESGPSAEVRRLQKLADKKDVSGLAREVSGSNAQVARTAVEKLADVGGADARREIERAWTDARPEVREAVVTNYARVADPQNVSLLAGAMQGTQPPDVRAAAAKSIGQLRAWNGLDALLAGLNDPDPYVRRAAYGALQEVLPGVRWEYNPDQSAPERARAIAAIRSSVPNMKNMYDAYMRKLNQSGGR